VDYLFFVGLPDDFAELLFVVSFPETDLRGGDFVLGDEFVHFSEKVLFLQCRM